MPVGIARPRVNPEAGIKKLKSGFTLIEVIFAMAILMTVIGGVYGIANGSMQLGKIMSEARIHDTRITNFVTTWREYLENLPPQTTISVAQKASRKFGRGSLLFENGPAPFAWSRAVRLCPAVEFKLVPAKDGTRSTTLWVRHLDKPKRATSPDDYEVVAELPLIEGLREFGWEFYDPEKKKWVTLWEDKPTPPLFMRLKFSFVTEPRDKGYEYVFWFSGGNRINELGGAAPQPAMSGQPVTGPNGQLPNGQFPGAAIPPIQQGGVR